MKINRLSNRLLSKKRIMPFFMAFLFFGLQLFSSVTLILINTPKVSAATNLIGASAHQGQQKPGSTYTSGNVTTYSEQDRINFRFSVDSSQSATGQMQVEFTSNDVGCLFFDGSFNLGTYDGSAPTVSNVIGSAPVVTKVGSSINNGTDWVQQLSVSFSSSGSAVINYYLKLSDQAGSCNGSSQHSRLGNSANPGDFKNIGTENVPVPANQIIELPTITVNKLIDNDGNGTPDRTAMAGEWSFSLDFGSPTATDSNGQVVFRSVSNGPHLITESGGPSGQIFANGNGTNCFFLLSVATATVSSGTTASDAVCNFVNRALPGSITIRKDAIPNHADDFNFTAVGSGVGNFTLDDDSNAVGSNNTYSNSKTFSGLAPGNYTFSENSLNGWSLGDISCSQGTSVQKNGASITINLSAAQSVTCTYTNRKNGTITVNKTTVPANDPTAFAVSATNNGGAIISNPSQTLSSSSPVIYEVAQNGVYNIDESPMDGWVTTTNTCNNLSITDTNLSQNCTITNTKLAKITIIKDSLPNDPQEFGFLTSANLGNGFVLDDDDQSAVSNQQVFDNLMPSTQYVIDEVSTAGWDLTNLVCIGGGYTVDGTKVTITPSAGQEISCTYTNTKRGSLSGFKFEDINGNGIWDIGENTLSDWKIFIDDNDNGIWDIGEKSILTDSIGLFYFGDLLPGSYTLLEDMQDGWEQTISPSNPLILLAGEDKPDLNFGNFKNGYIDGYKYNDINGNGVWNDDEPGLKGWKVSLYTKNPNSNLYDVSFAVTTTDDDGWYGFANLPMNSYMVCEGQQTGWRQTAPDTSCYMVDIDQSGEINSDVDFGNQQLAQLKIAKKIVSTNVTSDVFDLILDDGVVFEDAGDGDNSGYMYVTPGWHKVAEAEGNDSVDLDNYYVEFSQNCWGGDIHLESGQQETCTITNSKKPKLTVVKSARPNDAQDFSFSVTSAEIDEPMMKLNSIIDNPLEANFVLDDDDDPILPSSHTLDKMDKGSYVITENLVEGWAVDNIECQTDNGTRLETNQYKIDLDYGDDITCVFHNTKLAKLTITKNAGPKSLQAFEFSHNIDDQGEFSLVDDGSNQLNSKTFTNVYPSVYGISESQVDGWLQTDFSCDNVPTILPELEVDEKYDHKIRLEPGQEVNCVFVNKQKILLLDKSNDRPNITSNGDQVTYTLNVSVPEDAVQLYDVILTDLPPNNFKYVSGSWTANSSLRGDIKLLGTTTEPTYGSPGQWKLGNMMAGEKVTLTYLASIGGGVSPGSYPDIAFANGYAMDESMVYDNLTLANTPFVSTKVTVGKETPTLVINQLANTGDRLSVLSIVIPSMMILISVAGAWITRSSSLKGGK